MFNRKATPTILIAIALTVAALALSACYAGAPAATPVDTAASFDPAAASTALSTLATAGACARCWTT